MWMTTKLAIGGLVLAVAALDSAPVSAQSVIKPAKVQAASADNGVLVVSRGVFPRTERVEVSRGKSLMVQFPFVLRDVLVSDPGRLDAVVQSSDRVFLIAKKMGEVNVFFFNDKGDHVLTLDVDVGAGKGLLSSSEGKDNAVERALQSLNEMLANLVPGSRIISKRVGHSVILTGSVPNAASSSRAATIAREYARAWINQTQSESARVSSSSSDSSGTWQRGEEGGSGNRRSSSESESESYSKTTVNPNQKDEKLVINLLTIEGGEQVMIQVVVAEVQRSIMKQFGINLGAQINSGNFATALLTENALPLTAAAGLGKLPIPGLGTGSGAGCLAGGTLCSWNQGPASGTYGNSGFNGGFGSANNRMNYAMRMMERDGLIRTLAEPNLTAVSGETAKFLAGGEYPIPVVDASGQQSVTYKEYGVGVAFTPVVLSEGRISLKIETEVSELTDVGGVTLSSISIPALKKRQAKSTVELPSGGTLALAGLLSEDTRKNIDGFPGLKDVPVLGTLFRSNDFIKSETELVVLVTPYMVKPAARQKFAKPDDGFAPASDLKFNLLGHINRVYGKDIPPPSKVGLKDGGVGFIID
jgi:pilus assembly protein CpaC